ncbi:hypothetical protein QR680_015635 [Steinernema hermaphroditum]|uniref:Uncharacterized protein n=1 Tax=Steinernema hermaphroditum TaxID=289476 RepID=A0AA39HB25_9BILA|nr:hypothetical protein QR680_015635 [Steinernema hermaphroditum]
MKKTSPLRRCFFVVGDVRIGSICIGTLATAIGIHLILKTIISYVINEEMTRPGRLFFGSFYIIVGFLTVCGAVQRRPRFLWPMIAYLTLSALVVIILIIFDLVDVIFQYATTHVGRDQITVMRTDAILGCALLLVLANVAFLKIIWGCYSEIVSTVPLSVLYLASIVFYMEDPQTKRDGYITVCFGSSDLMNVFSIAAFLYVTSVIVLCLAFISRVVWVMKTKMANVSKKTKDMQRMLTITLIVTVSIPIVLGGLPVFLAFYAVSIRVENAAQMFRIIFLASIGQGLTNITSTLLLVKPYRIVILSVFRRKNKNAVVMLL